MPVTNAFDDAPKIAPLPTALTERFAGDWHVHGQGLFTWSVFRVYRAALHIAGECFAADQIYALDLNYLRNVTAEQIAQTSVDEMQRIADVDAQTAERWGELLVGILPDVKLGDRLIGVFEPGVGVAFFNRDGVLGEIRDPAFVIAFAAVWLDEQTRAPALRAKLLGLEQG
ncbi:chalcone isomerase family protein [Orrella daihaiensis]|uniref:Chalcone isomerase family protein n=1 Tax=Orrella daihaiensis TaxID=2782176 RepID=A0ABY4AHI7_9BURK|nr:chalcone isomerase family protein [Orrella daihaiensis]UOD49754.1 chalcone isomerase family protein [Orrella daihaiensis]